MPFRAFAIAVLLALPPLARAAEGPTAEAVAVLKAAYEAERAAAAPGDAVAAADNLAKKAAAMSKLENYAAAARLIRDARWQLPALPLDLPAGARVVGYSRLRHSERVNAVAYNRDGALLASAGSDRIVRIWDLANGRELVVYRGHPAFPEEEKRTGFGDVPIRIGDVAFSPTANLIASSSFGEVHLWEPTTGKLVRKLTMPGAPKLVKTLAFRPDGKALLTGGDDKTARLWDLETGKEIWTSVFQGNRIESVAFHPNGKTAAAVDADGLLIIYDASGTKKQPVLKMSITDGGSIAAYGVRFTPDGTKLFTGGADKLPRLTPTPGDGSTAATLAAAAQKFAGHTGDITGVAVTPDGKFFATSSKDKSVRVWDGAGKTIRVFQGHLGIITALAIRPDGRQLASAGDDGAVRLWDLTAVDDHLAASDATGPLWTAAISPDGATFAAAGADRTIRIYDAVTGKRLHALTGHKAAVTVVVYPAADTLASAAGDKLVKLWNAKTGAFVRDLEGHSAAVLALAVDDTGRLVSGSADKSVKGWDPATGKTLWTWTGPSTVTAVAVRPGGTQVAVGTADGGLTLLAVDGTTAKIGATLSAHAAGVAALSYHPDGSRLATVGGDGQPKIWTIPETGLPTVLVKLEAAAKTTATTIPALSTIAFTADGRQVAAAGADGVVRIWDAANGAEQRALRGPTDWVTAIAFSPDGERLLAASVDKVARLFGLARADTFRGGHGMATRAVATNKDGSQYASVSDDRTLKVWDAASGRELATLSGAADKMFTVAFAGPNRVLAAGDDGRLRGWSVAPPKSTFTAVIGKTYTMTPGPDGASVAIWWRQGESIDTYAIHPADGGKATASIEEKGRKVTAATFAADLSRAASGDETGNVRLWDLKTRQALGELWLVAGKKPVADLGLSPDKATLLLVDTEGGVHVADIAGRKVTHTGKASADGINGLVVAPAGGRFAVLGTAGDVTIFDATATAVKTWKLPTPANGAAFAPNGKSLITANADGSLFVLPVP